MVVVNAQQQKMVNAQYKCQTDNFLEHLADLKIKCISGDKFYTSCYKLASRWGRLLNLLRIIGLRTDED